MEFPQLLSEVEKVKQFVESKGIKFTRLQADTSFEYLLSEKPNNWKTEKHIYHDIDPQGLGWASPRARWCTCFLKTDVISKYFRELNKQYHVVNLIGIAADEKKRLERPGTSNKHNRYPLNEWGWTEGDCLQYCYDRGITWGGLYEHFNRVSCWCCPLQSLTDLREMYHCFPDLWSELKRLDNNQWRVFKQYDTVQSLEDRFKFEDERKANGLSIKNKEFFDELHKRCPPRIYKVLSSQ